MRDYFTIQFNSDIAKESNETRISFYANIGFFIELAQMFEFNLRKLLCYELSVKEIAYIVGYTSLPTFSKKYSDYFGVSPSKYQ